MLRANLHTRKCAHSHSGLLVSASVFQGSCHVNSLRWRVRGANFGTIHFSELRSFLRECSEMFPKRFEPLFCLSKKSRQIYCQMFLAKKNNDELLQERRENNSGPKSRWKAETQICQLVNDGFGVQLPIGMILLLGSRLA